MLKQEIGPWVVTFEWADDSTEGGPSSVTITPGPNATPADIAQGLSSTVLREVDFKSAVNAHLGITRQTASTEDIDTRSNALRNLLEAEGVSELYLAHLADAYVTLVQSGVHNVSGKLGEMTGRTPGAILQHLKKARKASLLTATPGRAGGQLTNSARELLA
ncbi:hypothetical protein [Rhodococcus opacus]|uniref:hypothetical protein n=1 Tax=Rhodococcus opacus TaxID=37919 RepID=UPI00294939CD|nr:hypothetical protein [Rhodococcus opacus]MDV6246884.1 hypothetical protein [Rhodococcus opacus]